MEPGVARIEEEHSTVTKYWELRHHGFVTADYRPYNPFWSGTAGWSGAPSPPS